MRLSPNFTLDEFTVSEMAERLGIVNEPDADQIDHLRQLASTLEVIRAAIDAPVQILSGYRCKNLNSAVNGARNSAHMDGFAADIIAPSFGAPMTLCKAIATMPGLQFDQVIYEFGRWCHLSIDPKMRHQILTIDRNGTRTGLQA